MGARTIAGAIAFGAMVVSGACGGTAVVDGVNDPGGDGGTTTTGTTTTTTGTTTTTTTSGACTQACNILATCGHQQDCVGPCQNQDPACSALHQQFVSCFAQTAQEGTCSYPSFNCIDPLVQWVFECEGWQPGEIFCDGGPQGDCFCYFEVFDPTYFFEQYCYFAGAGQIFCDCFRNSEYTGSCQSNDSNEACDPIGGCCMALNMIDIP